MLSIHISAGKGGDADVWWDFQAGPGKLTPTGAITLAGEPTCRLKVRMALADARRHASAVLAFLNAWDVLRLSQHKEMVSGFSPYTLAIVGTNDEGEEIQQDETMLAATAVLPANGVRHNGTAAHHPPPGNKGRLPSTRATATATAVALAEKVFRPLVYQDMTLVDMENAVEVATFQAFQAASMREQKDRAELKQFYENRK